MKATILYGANNVRFEEHAETDNHQTDGCHRQAGGDMRVRI
jgi:hypothetical protein